MPNACVYIYIYMYTPIFVSIYVPFYRPIYPTVYLSVLLDTWAHLGMRPWLDVAIIAIVVTAKPVVLNLLADTINLAAAAALPPSPSQHSEL